jgi:hypothetical protein
MHAYHDNLGLGIFSRSNRLSTLKGFGSLQMQSDTMSPQSSECSSDNFSVEDLFSQTDLSQNIPFDFTLSIKIIMFLIR